MKIQPIVYNNKYLHNNKYAPSFGNATGKRIVTDPTTLKNKEIWCTTHLFRDGVNYWNHCATCMDNNFLDKDLVNIHCMACSDGSEAYSIRIALNENVAPQRLGKFRRIIASDNDRELIEQAKTGRINLEFQDIMTLQNNINSRINYFTSPDFPIGNYSTDSFQSYKVSPILRDSVIFKHSDIVSELKKIEDNGNSAIFSRNVTPYLDKEYLNEMVDLLHTKLKTGSLFFLGDFDNLSNIRNLISPGFKKICEYNVYKKI